ncbi:type II secretion system F family protein [Oxyplasma meridianum]|uniref:Type II secretion system F family protein n=1 Tax=Oxyplasma meridianum TaxID=3073602 RepID=A0AAX4NGZ8_9ARCH
MINRRDKKLFSSKKNSIRNAENPYATMNLSFPARAGIRIFKPFLDRLDVSYKTQIELKRSKIPLTPYEFYGQMFFYSLISAIIIGISAFIFDLVLRRYALVISSSAFLIFALFIAVYADIPHSVARARRKRIDALIPVTIGFTATMASADVPIDRIFEVLSESSDYGEVAREAKYIWISTNLFGKDIITAIKNAIVYTPSIKFSEFLQGIVTTVTSGGDLKDYLVTRARRYQSELNNEVKKNVDSIGIVAESYITVGVAFPLIMIIIIGVIAALSSSDPHALILVLIFIVAVMMPVLTLFFIYFLNSIVKEVRF